jgi:hypothetical protein
MQKAEYVTYSGGTAKVKSIYANGFIILTEFNQDQPPQPGETIYGIDSGDVLTLPLNFEYDEKYSFYDEFDVPFPPPNLLALNEAQTEDGVGGPWIALDAHFTGLPSANAQIKYLITVE